MFSIKSIFRFLLFGNVWVSAGALFLYTETCLLYQLKFNLSIALGIFFATYSVYNLHRILGGKLFAEPPLPARWQWIRQHALLLGITSIISFLISTFLFLPFIQLPLLCWIAPFLFLSAGYAVPFLKLNGRWLRLRDIPLIKVFLVAAVWTFVTFLFPFICENPNWQPSLSLFAGMAMRFVFILAITLPFDVRDLSTDAKSGIQTFASLLGIKRLKTLCHLLLIVFIAISFFSMTRQWVSGGHALGLLISGLSTGWIVSLLSGQNEEIYYLGLLDGTMADQLFWIWLMGWLF